jgi:hypothetical protein
VTQPTSAANYGALGYSGGITLLVCGPSYRVLTLHDGLTQSSNGDVLSLRVPDDDCQARVVRVVCGQEASLADGQRRPPRREADQRAREIAVDEPLMRTPRKPAPAQTINPSQRGFL